MATASGLVSRIASSRVALLRISFTPHSSRPLNAESACASAACSCSSMRRTPSSLSNSVHRRSGTIVVSPSTCSSTSSCARATRASQSRSLRLRRRASSANSERGTRLTSAAKPAASTCSTGRPSTPDSETPCGAPATQYAQTSSSVTARADLLLQAFEPFPQLAVLLLELSVLAAGIELLQRAVALPPVDAHLARAIDRCDQQPQLDRQQLDVQQVDLDVAGDDDPLVEHTLEDVGQVRFRRRPSGQRVRRAGRQAAVRFHAHSSAAWLRWKRRVRR